MQAMTPVLRSLESYPGEAAHLLRYFTGYAPAFRQAADSLMSEVNP
jgi:hypothetical protein